MCEYWFNVDCASAESFYGLNDNIGEVPAAADTSATAAAAGSYESPVSVAAAASSPSGSYSAPSEASYQQPPAAAGDSSYAAPAEVGGYEPPLASYSASQQQRTGRTRQQQGARLGGRAGKWVGIKGEAINDNRVY